jgi:polysaccharide biosynthesis protein PslG
MSLARLRMLTLAALLAIVLPVLASCGGTPETPAANPTAPLPTAAVATAAPATSEPQPATSEPQPATSEPQPATSEPQPTTASVDSSLIIEPGKPIKTKYLNFGIVNHLFYTDRERVLTLDKIAGFDWVRQQVVWKDVEGPNPGNYAWGELDNIVNDVSTHNLKLLVNIVQAPSFYNETNGLPQDPKTMGNLVEAMVQRYGDKIAAYEIWNEQNLAHENGGRVTEEDAGHYVEILAEAYERIKALNPNIIVLAGAPSSSGVNDPAIAVSDENYYRAMYRYKDGMIKDHFDAQGVHPGGSANPPDTMWPDNPSQAQGWTNDPTFYFRHIENVRKFMEEEGVGDHQIWITEFGWATENNTPGYEFGNQVSFDQQSDYITGAIKWSFENYRYPDDTPWLGNMFLWNMNFAVIWAQNNPPNPLNEQASFGILNPDYSPRPAFLELQGLLPQLKQQQGR